MTDLTSCPCSCCKNIDTNIDSQLCQECCLNEWRLFEIEDDTEW